jgi:hypothetical protein
MEVTVLLSNKAVTVKGEVKGNSASPSMQYFWHQAHDFVQTKK